MEILFNKLGLNPTDMVDLTEEKAIELVTGIETRFKTRLLESEDFYKGLDETKLPSEFRDKYLNQGTAKIDAIAKRTLDKEFALTEEDKKQFVDEDFKDISKYILKVKSIFSAKTSSGNKNIDDLQNDNLSLKQKLSEYETQMVTLQTKFDSDLTEKLTQKEVETLTLIEASKLAENLHGHIGATYKLVYPLLLQKYAVLVENGVVSIRKKDNPSYKIEVDNAGKKEFLTIDKALEIEYKALGFWKEKTSTPPIAGSVRNTNFATSTTSQAVLDKIAKEKSFLN